MPPVVAWILGAISTAASLIAIVEVVNLVRNRDRLSWRMVSRATRKTLKEIQQDGPSPDLVIGVGRGGAIVAGMIAGNLDLIPMCVLDTEPAVDEKSTEVSVRNGSSVPDLTGKKVLIVIGELYSGVDMRLAIEEVKKRSPEKIKTLALFAHKFAGIQPDYVGKELKNPLSAPWRLTDAYKNKRI